VRAALWRGFEEGQKKDRVYRPYFSWSGKRDLNSRLQPWQGCTLPLSYSRVLSEAVLIRRPLRGKFFLRIEPGKKIGRTGRPDFLERETRFELATSTLARLHSTTELLPHCWRRHPDLNWRMEVLQTSALPLGYAAFVVERETRFELATSTLARLHSTTELLPLNEETCL